MPMVSKWLFQDPATIAMEYMISFHDLLVWWIVLISIFVMIAMFNAYSTYSHRIIPHSFNLHGTTIETIWTITPAIILILIAIPSFELLYMLDDVSNSSINIICEGHQWYWSYEINGNKFDSYMLPAADLEYGTIRMLEVDNRLVLPVNTSIRAIVTSADVIHSWAVPSLAIKVDAVPGRLNSVPFNIYREGVYYGQCSELCGVLHSSMPIVVESVNLNTYISWLSTII